MRKVLILAPLLLAGCVNDSASYFVDGNEHTLTVRAKQATFWDDHLTLRLVAARLPDCQRQLELGDVPADGLNVELFAHADNVFTLRAGNQLWQVETQHCNQLPAPQAPTGQTLGAFVLVDDKMQFVAAEGVAGAAQD